MRVLVVGVNRVPHVGASFLAGLQTLGHDVRIIDPTLASTFLDRRPCRPITRRIFGGLPSAYRVFRMLLTRACTRFRPEVLLAVGGSLDKEVLLEIRKRTSARLIMYSTDNPFNPVVSPAYVREALPCWDAIATPRVATIPLLRKHCPGNVFYLPFGYDPDVHFPEQPATEAERAEFCSDVAFVGACDPDRVPYLDPLARSRDLSVSYYGGYYRFTPALQSRYRGYVYGRPYRMVLNTAHVAVCIVRRANSDGHVMRTFEIPACGAFQLAERTDEHESMFKEDSEVAFFDSPEELLDKVRFYLRNSSVRNKIAQCGYNRTVGSPNTYRDRVAVMMRHVS